jgi:tRNA dimethylallyltransferase
LINSIRKKNKVLVILGPTASGKSALAVRLAKKFKGEIISADSRQVYKGLNIGTGKITKKEMRGVPHHLLDVADPKKQFSVAEYVELAKKKLEQIKFPIIVGGTGFYIDALTGRASLPNVPPNKKLREKLNKKSAEELFKILKKKDLARAKTVDKNNKVRLIRALEIIEKTGKVPKASPKSLEPSPFVYIGLKPDDLEKRIYSRLIKRIPGILRETKKLFFKRAHELGLEYRYATLYLKKKLTKQEFVDQLYTAIRQYAKRQMTWFKRNKQIKWFGPGDYKEIEEYVRVALKGD